MNYKLVSEGEVIKAVYFKTIESLVVMKSIPNPDLPKKEWLVFFNNSEQFFQFDGLNFYCDEPNKVEQTKELEEHTKLVEQYTKDGKTEGEIRALIEGKGSQYIDRVLYKITSKDDVIPAVNTMIKSIS